MCFVSCGGFDRAAAQSILVKPTKYQYSSTVTLSAQPSILKVWMYVGDPLIGKQGCGLSTKCCLRLRWITRHWVEKYSPD